MNQISQQLDSGEEENIKLNSKLNVLKLLLCLWLYEALLGLPFTKKLGGNNVALQKLFNMIFKRLPCAQIYRHHFSKRKQPK